jgi:hypothetical protein
VSQPATLDGPALLRGVSTALAQLSRRQVPGDPVYDDSVQRAYNRLVLHCLNAGVEPPESVPGMVTWAAATPLGQWPADLASARVTGAEVLVDPETRVPTQACMEFAMPVADAAAELFENVIISTALEACRAARSPKSYTAFRRLLITRPVLTGADLVALATQIELMPALEVIRRCYEPAPAAYLRNGAYRGCGRCGCLLVPLRNGGYCCELDRCRNDGGTTLGLELPPSARVLQLSRPLRVFITSPGIAETELEAALSGPPIRLRPEMWPQFDAYDLRVPFPDGSAWAVDVKDWASPSLLAARMHALPPDPPFTRAFIVVPEYRFRVREDYARAFRSALPPGLESALTVCSDTEFLDLARKQLRRAKRRATAKAQAASTAPAARAASGGDAHA